MEVDKERTLPREVAGPRMFAKAAQACRTGWSWQAAEAALVACLVPYMPKAAQEEVLSGRLAATGQVLLAGKEAPSP